VSLGGVLYSTTMMKQIAASGYFASPASSSSWQSNCMKIYDNNITSKTKEKMKKGKQHYHTIKKVNQIKLQISLERKGNIIVQYRKKFKRNQSWLDSGKSNTVSNGQFAARLKSRYYSILNSDTLNITFLEMSGQSPESQPNM